MSVKKSISRRPRKHTSLMAELAPLWRDYFYLLVAFLAMLGIGLVYYWLLTRTTTFGNFIAMTVSDPLYLVSYLSLTVLSILLFGGLVSLTIYLWQRKQAMRASTASSAAGGVTLGALAAACPVCGAYLLSLLGVAGGLSVFPLAGLELKIFAVFFMAGALYFSLRQLAQSCTTGTCMPRKRQLKPRHNYPFLWACYVILGLLFWQFFGTNILLWQTTRVATARTEVVIPVAGQETNVSFGMAISKLITAGVIDPEKFRRLYQRRGGIPNWVAQLLAGENTDSEITFSSETAPYLINLLWPIGLANQTTFNKRSRLNSKSLFNFASTGGWRLGQATNGGEYFNQYAIVPLTPEQEAIVFAVAQNTYRPCCNNSTFFQDCNHGSALLGLLQLGASQGLDGDKLYSLALIANSYWFPNTYLETALYFERIRGIAWKDVDPREVMSAKYSSATGWRRNVKAVLQQQGIVPIPVQRGSGGGCGV